MTAAGREELRRDLVARIPGGYSPLAHLLVPSLLGICAIGGALSLLRDLEPWQLGFVPVFLILGNAVEWHTHRSLLHRHVRLLAPLYRAHSQHHAVYGAEGMAIRHPRELKLVLLPAYAVLVIIGGGALPVAVALFFAGQENLAALWIASAVACVLCYEWLHLSHHLPGEGPLARLAPLDALRRHHAVHHSPQLMHRWNLNVTLPLWDWVRGTVYRPERRTAPTRS
jgi:sterol desaturase/sphingolipid hydroxylase (fatty acid hydroxylase superfamily)